MMKTVENPKDRAARHRLDMSLAPDTAVAYMALGFTEGHYRYGGFNWRAAGVSASVYKAAAIRHISKWYNGDEVDEETGVPHLASALACLGILVDAQVCGKLKDDRPPRAPLAEVFKEFELLTAELHTKIGDGPGRYIEGEFTVVEGE